MEANQATYTIVGQIWCWGKEICSAIAVLLILSTNNLYSKFYIRYYGQHWPGFKRHSRTNLHQFNNPATNNSYVADAGIAPDEEGQITTQTDNPSQVQDADQDRKPFEENDRTSNVNLSTQYNDHTPLLQ